MRCEKFAALAVAAGVTILLAACSTAPTGTSTPAPGEAAKPGTARTPSKKPQVVLKKGGGFYKDDGPAEDIPENLDDIPDAEPKLEPIHPPATKPYVVLGKEYVPNATLRPYKARGIASWYGKKFHGQKTSIGEPYDMFAMTAAHTTLAIPSYVRVTSLQSGKSVVVRVTDRGPFHADRVIDLSYTAAWKLGLVANGSGQVEVEAILPGDMGTTALAQALQPPRPGERDEIAELAKKLVADNNPPATPAAGGNDGALQRGIYLQLGAFSNADNAESLKNHLTRELDWLTESMQVNNGGGIHRVHLGPYASRADAGKVAEKIRLAVGYKPTIVTR